MCVCVCVCVCLCVCVCVCVCVCINSRNHVPRVARRYGTIAAHTRRRASVLLMKCIFNKFSKNEKKKIKEKTNGNSQHTHSKYIYFLNFFLKMKNKKKQMGFRKTLIKSIFYQWDMLMHISLLKFTLHHKK